MRIMCIHPVEAQSPSNKIPNKHSSHSCCVLKQLVGLANEHDNVEFNKLKDIQYQHRQC